MIKLNDNSLFVGQIKQILHNFNLPLCQIGDKYPAAGNHFISNGKIWVWNNALEKIYCSPYVFGKKYLNLTSTFPITNLIYDRETHRYLGKFLRFLRDYYQLNLMSMYNCFDDELYQGYFSFNFLEHQETIINFNSNDPNYFIYRVPTSAFDLTVSCHTQASIELCAYIENSEKQYKELIKKLGSISYVKRTTNEAFIYHPLESIKNFSREEKQFINSNLKNFYILVKVPRTLASSITILEGIFYQSVDLSYMTYRPCAPISSLQDVNLQKLLSSEDAVENLNKLLMVTPDTSDLLDLKESEFKIKSQLLSSENASKKYLLGDRLVEYLCNNVICNFSGDAEITKLQQSLHNIPSLNMHQKENSNYYFGKWNKKDSLALKKFINQKQLNQNFDVLGFLDKDVEQELRKEVELI